MVVFDWCYFFGFARPVRGLRPNITPWVLSLRLHRDRYRQVGPVKFRSTHIGFLLSGPSLRLPSLVICRNFSNKGIFKIKILTILDMNKQRYVQLFCNCPPSCQHVLKGIGFLFYGTPHIVFFSKWQPLRIPSKSIVDMNANRKYFGPYPTFRHVSGILTSKVEFGKSI